VPESHLNAPLRGLAIIELLAIKRHRTQGFKGHEVLGVRPHEQFDQVPPDDSFLWRRAYPPNWGRRKKVSGWRAERWSTEADLR